RKIQQRVLPCLCIRPAFKRRRRAAEYNDCALEARTHDRDFTRVISRRLALLVTRLVFFVDGYCAEVCEGSEHCRPGADRNSFVATLQCKPRIVSLAIAQCGVKNRDVVSENGAEAIDR